MTDSSPARSAICCALTRETIEVRQLKDGNPALPAGWKTLNGAYYSSAAWRKKYSLWTVRFPVVGIECNPASEWAHRDAWKSLRSALRTSWRQATQLANWMMTELAKADDVALRPSPQGPKLPNIPQLTVLMRRIYQEGRQRWPELDSQSFSSIRHRVLAKYKQVRFDLRCRSAVSLPSYRYPTPLPIPAKDTRLSLENGVAILSVRISGERFCLRLKGGRDFHRPLQAVRGIIEKTLLQGEVSLYEQVVGGAHHAGGKDHAIGLPTRLMAAITAWLPNDESVVSERRCLVTTQKDRLWRVQLDQCDEPWYLNEDQVPRWTMAYHRPLQRLREDCNLDRRTRSPDNLSRRRAELRTKFRNRIRDACHKAAAMLVGFCRRHHVGFVEYDDSNKSWLVSFPWHQLRQVCADQCVAAGIAFNHGRRAGNNGVFDQEPTEEDSTETSE